MIPRLTDGNEAVAIRWPNCSAMVSASPMTVRRTHSSISMAKR